MSSIYYMILRMPYVERRQSEWLTETCDPSQRQCAIRQATQCFHIGVFSKYNHIGVFSKYNHTVLPPNDKEGNWTGPLAQPDGCTIEVKGQVP